MQSLEAQLKQFVVDNFLFGKQNGFSSEDSFLEKGIIDSTGMVELIFHLESTYEIKVEDSELVPENLDSIQRLVAFVERKKAAAEKASSHRAS
ncbi:MAG: acyl carrier protein [Candidatus Acidiferrum sp.]